MSLRVTIIVMDCTLWPSRALEETCVTNRNRLMIIFKTNEQTHVSNKHHSLTKKLLRPPVDRRGHLFEPCDFFREHQHIMLRVSPANSLFNHHGNGDEEPATFGGQTSGVHGQQESKSLGGRGFRKMLSSECSITVLARLPRTLSVMNSYEVSLNYAPAEHGGDRRKTSQQCPSFALSRDVCMMCANRKTVIFIYSTCAASKVWIPNGRHRFNGWNKSHMAEESVIIGIPEWDPQKPGSRPSEPRS